MASNSTSHSEISAHSEKPHVSLSYTSVNYQQYLDSENVLILECYQKSELVDVLRLPLTDKNLYLDSELIPRYAIYRISGFNHSDFLIPKPLKDVTRLFPTKYNYPLRLISSWKNWNQLIKYWMGISPFYVIENPHQASFLRLVDELANHFMPKKMASSKDVVKLLRSFVTSFKDTTDRLHDQIIKPSVPSQSSKKVSKDPFFPFVVNESTFAASSSRFGSKRSFATFKQDILIIKSSRISDYYFGSHHFMFSNVKDLLGQLGFPRAIVAQGKPLKDYLKILAEYSIEIITLFQMVFNSITQMVGETIVQGAQLVVFFSNLTSIFLAETKLTAGLALASLVASFPRSSAAFIALGNQLLALFDIRPHAGDSAPSHSLAYTFASAIGSVFSSMCGTPLSPSFHAEVSKLRDVKTLIDSVSSVLRVCQKTLETILPWLFKAITGKDWNLSFIREQTANFVNDVRRFELSCLALRNNQIEDVEQLKVDFTKIKSTYYELIAQDNAPAAKNQIDRIYSDALKSYAAVAMKRSSQPTRPQPVCVWIRGPPNSGKTTLSNIIETAIALKYEIPSGESVFWNCSNDKKYDDGYANQFAVRLDDFLQSKDQVVQQEKALTLFEWMSDNDYPMHMASLEEKGKTFFDSKLVLVTSNVTPSKGAEFVECSDAFRRRVHFDICLTGLASSRKTTDDWILNFAKVDSNTDIKKVARCMNAHTLPEPTHVDVPLKVFLNDHLYPMIADHQVRTQIYDDYAAEFAAEYKTTRPESVFKSVKKLDSMEVEHKAPPTEEFIFDTLPEFDPTSEVEILPQGNTTFKSRPFADPEQIPMNWGIYDWHLYCRCYGPQLPYDHPSPTYDLVPCHSVSSIWIIDWMTRFRDNYIDELTDAFDMFCGIHEWDFAWHIARNNKPLGDTTLNIHHMRHLYMNLEDPDQELMRGMFAHRIFDAQHPESAFRIEIPVVIRDEDRYAVSSDDDAIFPQGLVMSRLHQMDGGPDPGQYRASRLMEELVAAKYAKREEKPLAWPAKHWDVYCRHGCPKLPMDHPGPVWDSVDIDVHPYGYVSIEWMALFPDQYFHHAQQLFSAYTRRQEWSRAACLACMMPTVAREIFDRDDMRIVYVNSDYKNRLLFFDKFFFIFDHNFPPMSAAGMNELYHNPRDDDFTLDTSSEEDEILPQGLDEAGSSSDIDIAARIVQFELFANGLTFLQMNGTELELSKHIRHLREDLTQANYNEICRLCSVYINNLCKRLFSPTVNVQTLKYSLLNKKREMMDELALKIRHNIPVPQLPVVQPTQPPPPPPPTLWNRIKSTCSDVYNTLTGTYKRCALTAATIWFLPVYSTFDNIVKCLCLTSLFIVASVLYWLFVKPSSTTTQHIHKTIENRCEIVNKGSIPPSTTAPRKIVSDFGKEPEVHLLSDFEIAQHVGQSGNDYEANRIKFIPKKAPVIVSAPRAESSLTSTTATVIDKNLVEIRSPSILHGLFLKDRMMLTVAHLLCGEKLPVAFTCDEGEFQFSDYQMVSFPDYDLMILVFPAKDDSNRPLSSFRNIVPHFCTESEKSYLPEHVTRLETNGILTSNIRITDIPCQISYRVREETISVPMCLSLAIRSLPGDCGLPYFHDSKLLAVHIAGTGVGAGYARITTREYIEDLLSSVSFKISGQSWDIRDVELDSPSVASNPVVLYCKSRILKAQHWMEGDPETDSYRPKCLTRLPQKSKLLLNPAWLNTEDIPEIPAALSTTYGKNPMHEALKRIGEKPAPPEMNLKVLDFCIDKVRKAMFPANLRTKVLSLAEAYNGIPGLKPVQEFSSDGIPVSFDSSGKPGYLFTSHINKNGDMVRHPTPEAFAYDQMLTEEQFERFPFTLSLKDELLDPSKVSPELIKTRSFCTGSKPFNIHVKRYFGQAVAIMHSSFTKSAIKVGIPMGTFNTPKLADDVNHLPTDARLLLTDVKSMDYSQYYEHAHRILSGVFLPAMPKQHHKHMKAILTAILCPHIAHKRAVFQVESIVPSGVFGTAEINTPIREVYELYTLIMEYGYKILDDVIFMHSYGDDQATAVTGDITLPAFIAAFKKHVGWTITPGNKSLVVPDFYTRDEYQFLQRVYHNGRFCLLKPKLYTAGRFYKGKEITAKQAIDSMLLEASYWGREVFNDVLSYYQKNTTYTVWPEFIIT